MTTAAGPVGFRRIGCFTATLVSKIAVHLAARSRTKSLPEGKIDVVADEPHAAITHQDVNASDMTAASRRQTRTMTQVATIELAGVRR